MDKNYAESILRDKLCDPSDARLNISEISHNKFITQDKKLKL